MNALIQRVRLALTTRPDAKAWREHAIASAWILALYAVVGFSTGLIHFAPRLFDLPAIAAMAFVVPCFTEELFFRGLLVPGPNESAHPWRWIAGSTVVFTLWHIVETAFLPASAPIFLRADFLALAATLGLTCAILRWRSGSLWPAVLLHWLVVVLWQGWFGGPSLGELR